jgi:molecular chaperone DnaK
MTRPPSPSPCFGIDLGTSCSAIGWTEGGVPRLLPVDDAGDELLPSVVSFPLDKPPLIGKAAINSLQLIPERTVVSSKRKIGSDHAYPFTHDGRPVTPVDVAALLLSHLTDAAERACGVRPQRVVITVPAWFTQAQRNDTRRAGAQAGLEVVRIINEPTAAALAHARHLPTRRRALVYDLGGGTFDVSLIEQDGAIVEVKASHGDTELGGDDVDVIMRDRVLRRLDLKDRDFVDAIAASKPAMLRLKVALEQAKIELSQRPATLLALPFLATVHGQPRHLEMELTTADLDYAAGFVLERTIESVDQVLKDAQFQATDLDALLLVGGSTQLPQVWHLLRDRYGLEGSHAVHPQRAVALGATIQAAIIDGLDPKSVLVDVAPYSLSVGVSDPRPSTGRMHFLTRVITPRNAPLPALHAETFYTSGERQTAFQVPIFQGAHPDARRNTFLGTVQMTDLRPIAGIDARPIRVDMRHDLDGIVHVSVTDVLTQRTTQTQLASDGTEQTDQRRDWLERMTRNNVIFGDYEAPANTDKDKQDPNAPTSADAPDTASAPDGVDPVSSSLLRARSALDDQLAKAQATFQGLLQAATSPPSDDPTRQLLATAQAGLDAITAQDRAAALSLLSEAEDLMFELGIYL